MFLQNAKDLRIKQLANCFVTENAFDNTEDKHANSEENAEFDYIGKIKNLGTPANHEADQRN